MNYLNIVSYIFSSLFVLLVLHTFLIGPLIVRLRNKRNVEKRMLDPESLTKYWKFNYDGPIYFEAPEQKNANRLFQRFRNNQKKFGKMYDSGQSKKKLRNKKNQTK